MWNEIQSKYRQIKKGLSVVTNKELVNGNIVIPKGISGEIVYAQNQVEADVWFYDDWKYRKCLNVETDSFKDTQFRGVVLTVKAKDFSIRYRHEEHDEMMFDVEKLVDIPYLDLSLLTSYEGRYYRGNEKVREYRLVDIIEQIENGFTQFVNKLEQRPTTEDDSTDLDYIFTDDSIELFEIEKGVILESFMKATGIYYNFMGGSIEG